jgi:hypothetical protein
MAANRGLRVATETDAPAKPKSLSEAVESGTYLEILEAQQREIATKVRDEKGPAAAALHRHLSLLSKEIAELRMTEDEDHSVVVNADDEVWDGTGY